MTPEERTKIREEWSGSRARMAMWAAQHDDVRVRALLGAHPEEVILKLLDALERHEAVKTLSGEVLS